MVPYSTFSILYARIGIKGGWKRATQWAARKRERYYTAAALLGDYLHSDDFLLIIERSVLLLDEREREKGEDAVYIVGKWKSWFYISTRGGPKRESAVIYICTDSAGVGGKTMKYRIDAVVRIQKNMTHLFLLGFSINSNNFFQTWNLAYSFTLARVKHPLRANTKKRSPIWCVIQAWPTSPRCG